MSDFIAKFAFVSIALGVCLTSVSFADADKRAKAVYTQGSQVNVPVSQRKGDTSKVYFTRDLSAEGLSKVYHCINQELTGKIAIKLHTGEPNGPNIIPREWVQQLIANDISNGTIVETNTLYKGKRHTTEDHRETLKINGWTFAPVDIMDEEGTTMIPLSGGKYFKEMSMGAHIRNYDSMLVLTHFKGHAMGGFGGSNKNIGIGNADGRVGKGMIHVGFTDNNLGVMSDEFMERITESSKATLDHFGKHIAFINVLRNMSVDCDCAGLRAAPPTVPDIGILASTDILAVDQASIDLLYSLDEKSKDIRERIESRHGLRQLSYMKELGMGNDKYEIIDLDAEVPNCK
ncbi:DUF362 domain-containing protein [bacterium]|nr:DUF362 domain-containing protein [bacterium]